jgi:cob(I)alamin adenosyltransferase
MEKEKRKCLIIVHTGDGKGKTTAAMGMALRAIGHELKVLMIQFIKGSWHYGELDAIKKLRPYFEIIPLGDGFIRLGKKEPDDKHVRAAIDAWNFCKEKIATDEFDMIILDEINYVIEYNFIPVEEVLKTLRLKPDRLCLVLTGRNAHPRIIEIADLVTEMKEVKHPFQKGVKAQIGIEF